MTNTTSPYIKAFRAFLDALAEHDFDAVVALVEDDFQIIRAPESLQQPPMDIQQVVSGLGKIFVDSFPKGQPQIFETKDTIPTFIAHVTSSGTTFKGNALRGEYVMFAEFETAKEGGGPPKMKKLTEFLDSKTTEEFYKAERNV
ncbi:hypothetical protein CYLTODRAFT_483700 [Cylindrobasidium torrendii FP15055 ss-10]|uniref:SnoaL-like domain-containing protein n=1 Tax=Cylindrobasidium torrendii FP15055 ss-10 TaxID=1314674 RepID=A0A0D7BBS6_9AGAR|nr:hypothetical protein CYLTODRAFT_483700 [Cylindrobasidium torrendii FP15055 ss-10]